MSDHQDEDVAIGARIKAIMGDLSDPAAAGIAGCSVNTYRRWIKGTYAADAKALGRIARARGVTVEWLLSGEEANPVLAAVDAVQTGMNDLAKRITRSEAAEARGRKLNVKPTASHDDEFVSISVHDVQFSAGDGLTAIREGRSTQHWRFPRQWLQERFSDLSGLRLGKIVGDSMEPELRDGDRLLFNVNKRALADGIHVVRLDDALMVKRVQVQGSTVRLLSTNPIYAPTVIEGAADDPNRFEIIGKAEWTGKMLG